MNEATAKQRAAVWVAVVFLLGATLGGVVGYIFAHRAVSANIMISVSQRRAQKVEELTRLAHLTPDQRQALFGNTARAMGNAAIHIKERHVANCMRADTAYGDGVAKALGLAKVAAD